MLILFVWIFHFVCVDELSTGYANLYQSLCISINLLKNYTIKMGKSQSPNTY